MEARKSITNNDQKLESLYSDARAIIESARTNAVRSVDFCRVQMYWHLGQRIFEEEQQGKERADYGAYLIKTLVKKIVGIRPFLGIYFPVFDYFVKIGKNL